MLAGTIGYWFKRKREQYDELEDLGRRVGILRNIDVKILKDPDLAWISVDGINAGLLSDGTLRILEILVDLIDPSTTLLLIEEPETAVHPGLLQRLLAEIDAYTIYRQVIVSTHSTIVVDWAGPSEVRLVERAEGRTVVSALDEAEVADAVADLQREGTLAEYIYGRTDE